MVLRCTLLLDSSYPVCNKKALSFRLLLVWNVDTAFFSSHQVTLWDEISGIKIARPKPTSNLETFNHLNLNLKIDKS